MNNFDKYSAITSNKDILRPKNIDILYSIMEKRKTRNANFIRTDHMDNKKGRKIFKLCKNTPLIPLKGKSFNFRKEINFKIGNNKINVDAHSKIEIHTTDINVSFGRI